MDTWKNQFSPFYEVPAAILDLCEKHLAKDTSWHNDACPSFTAFLDGQEFVDNSITLWVDHPVIEFRSSYDTRTKRSLQRFCVCLMLAAEIHHGRTVYTDDPSEAIAAFIALRNEFKDRLTGVMS